MAQIALFLLGSPQIERKGQPADTDRRKAVALLAYLAVTGQRHGREALAALFWPEADQSQALAYLRRTLWEINNMVGEGVLDVDRSSVGLATGSDLWLDVAEFGQLTAVSATLDELSQAAALYRDDFLAGFTLRDAPEFDQWQYYQADRLRQTLALALEKLAEGLADQGAWATAVAHAQRRLSLDPLHEPAHRQLMQLYAHMGQKAAALRQYESCAAILADELAVAPEPETTALYERIRRGDMSQTQPALAKPVTGERERPAMMGMPALSTPFVGRQPELAELTAFLQNPDVRLLSLVGPGGSGKTRLALEAARQQQPAFADGVYFVPLAPLNSADDVVTAVAKALRLSFFKESELPQRQLFDYVQSKQLLLVMDNYEHLLGRDGAHFVSDLLQAAPRLKILATSRVRLGLQAEYLYNVQGMRAPDLSTVAGWSLDPANGLHDLIAPYSALQLFAASARRGQPDFTLNAANVMDVARICQLVAGMPLAIELATAWLSLLTPAEIEAEIRHSLDFLETEMADVPDRQRSMRAVFNYSWQLLTPEEKRVLPLLTLFQGGFSREAAQQVAGASLRVLMALVQKSLVARVENGRFTIHELLRQYAAESLQADPEGWVTARQRHSAFYIHFLQTEGQRMQGPDQRAAFDAVEEESENVRAAWLWAMVQQQYEMVLPTLNYLLYFYLVRSTLVPALADLFDMVLEDLEAAVDPSAPPPQPLTPAHILFLQITAVQSWILNADYTSPRPVALSKKALELCQAWQAEAHMSLALTLAATIYSHRVDREAGIAWGYRSLEQLRQHSDRWPLTMAINLFGAQLHGAGVRQGVKELLDEGVTASRALGDELVLAYNLTTLAWVLTDERDFDHALNIYQECQTLFEKVGDRAGAAYNLWNLASVYDVAGEYARSAALQKQSRPLFADLGRRLEIANALGWESQMWQRLGDYDTARALRQEALTIFQEMGDDNGVAWSYFELGEVYRLLRQAPDMERMYAQSFAWFSRLQMDHGLTFYHRVQGQLKLAAGDVAGAQADLERSLALSHDTSEDYWNRAYTLCELARVALTQKDDITAGKRLLDALRLAERWASLGITLVILTGYARLWTSQGQDETAVELAALVLSHKATWAEMRPRAEQVMAEARARMDPLQFATAQARGQHLDVQEVVARLLQQSLRA